MNIEYTKIDFLGIGSAINSDQNHVSFIIDDIVMFECPPGIAKQVRRKGRDLNKINHLIISHLHGDHYFGIPFFLLEYALNKRNRELFVYSNAEIEKITNDLIKLAFPEQDILKMYEYTKVKYITYDENSNYNIDHKYYIEFAKVSHGSMLTHGVIVSCNKLKIFYTADTENFNGLAKIISLMDVLIIDATAKDFKIPYHLNYTEVYEFAKNNPHKYFFVTHRGIYNPTETLSNIILPNDNDVYRIWRNTKNSKVFLETI